jgi:hypothetical protein
MHRIVGGTGPGTGVVLLVEEDDGAARRLGGWLAGEGYWVLACPGPHPATDVCPGGRGETCPLVELADAIVLDVGLEGDTLMEGPPGWQLALHYLSEGKAVVAIAAPGDMPELLADERLIVLRPEPSRSELTSAVRTLAPSGRPGRLPQRALTIPFAPDPIDLVGTAGGAR